MNSASVSSVMTTSDGTLGDVMANSICLTKSSCKCTGKSLRYLAENLTIPTYAILLIELSPAGNESDVEQLLTERRMDFCQTVT